jgi:hypothetical protein
VPPRKKAAPDADEPTKNAAEAAAEEAANADLKVEFRGQEFVIPRSRLSDARFRLHLAAGRGDDLMLDLIGPTDLQAQNRFLSVIAEGESLVDISAEFFGAVNAATGVGNSPPSS